MTFGMTVLIILVVLLAVLVAAFLYRLLVLRRGGTAALLRVLPSPGDSGWRHGIIRYGESTFVFFKLSSLRPGPDSRNRSSRYRGREPSFSLGYRIRHHERRHRRGQGQ